MPLRVLLRWLFEWITDTFRALVIVQLHCPDPPTSNTGAFQISWDAGAGARVQLFEDGVLVYAGRDSGTTVTGQLAGNHVYVLRTDDGREQSCTIAVEPPAIELALGLFGVGALVFILTLALILRGDRQLRGDRRRRAGGRE